MDRQSNCIRLQEPREKTRLSPNLYSQDLRRIVIYLLILHDITSSERKILLFFNLQVGQQKHEEVRRLVKVLEVCCGSRNIFLTGLYCNLKITVYSTGSLAKVQHCHDVGLGIKVQTMENLLGWLS